jgi:uncharacterized protein YjiS (DUF1127 family)
MPSTLTDDHPFSSTTTVGWPGSTCRLDPIAAIRPFLAEWNRRRRFRKDLKRLLAVAPHMIADIGLTLDQAYEQIEAPFWRP